MPHTRDEWSTLVAILGTKISPYLFFWQASEEVEEEKAAGLGTLARRWRDQRHMHSRKRWNGAKVWTRN